MSWLNDFDSSGPTWEANVAAREEERRAMEMLEKIKSGLNTKDPIDPVVIAKLESLMIKLSLLEKKYMRRINSSSNLAIHESHIKLSKIRRHFRKIKQHYLFLNKVIMTTLDSLLKRLQYQFCEG